MKTQEKQRGTKKIDSKEKLESSELITEGVEKVRGKKVDGKRTHSRSFYMAINPKGGALANKKQLPVFWRKSLAKEVANRINGKAVKVSVSWQMA